MHTAFVPYSLLLLFVIVLKTIIPPINFNNAMFYLIYKY